MPFLRHWPAVIQHSRWGNQRDSAEASGQPLADDMYLMISVDDVSPSQETQHGFRANYLAVQHDDDGSIVK